MCLCRLVRARQLLALAALWLCQAVLGACQVVMSALRLARALLAQAARCRC